MLALFATPLHAQQKRLSDWLLEQPVSANAYPLGLSWRVPDEAPPQHALLLDALRILDDRAQTKADAAAVRRLREWLSKLPVTGRVPVAVADARWLQGNPSQDPVLKQGHTVVLPARPRTLTVVSALGTRCAVAHAPGVEALAYVRTCSPSSSQRSDWVWVAQPDGRIQRYGVALWNREAQDEPAPGAWIWAPPRDGGWPEKFSERLITFLATQGPAPDINAGLPVRGAVAQEGAKPPAAMASTQVPLTVQATTPAMAQPATQAMTPTAKLPPVTPPPAAPGFGLLSGLMNWANWTSRADEVDEVNQANAVTPAVLPAPAATSRSRSGAITASDWGSAGLLQTPTARMNKAGHLGFTLSRTEPYTHGNVFVQPFDWLETGFRYTDVSNRLYGPAIAGDQNYKDKSLDIRLRLWEESAWLPQLAVGVRDVTGTGLFAGEYFVGSKRTGPFDWSLGLGWGNVGARGDVRNPLGFLGRSVDVRKTDTAGLGGSFSLGNYFSGPAAFFGGVQYQTPWEPLILKLEYDGNNYQREPQGNNQIQTSPWNFGAVYRMGSAVDLSLGIERGNTVMLGFTLRSDLDGLSMPKLNDAPRVAVADARPARAPQMMDWAATSRDIRTQTEWHVSRIEQRGADLRVAVDHPEAFYWRERVDRVASVLHRDAPADVDRFTLAYRERGQPLAEHVIERDAWVAQQTQTLPPRERAEPVMAQAPEGDRLTRNWGNVRNINAGAESEKVHYVNAQPRFESGLESFFRQSLGGPDGFILFQVGAVAKASFRVREDTWLQGSLQVGVLDNYSKFKYTAPSNLPRVRTFVREYVTSSALTIPNLQATHVGKAGANHYYSVYGGLLEPMYAGVGGEWLYRPFASRVALGVDVNAVQQRDFNQDFALRDYTVATGHATLYWDTGWNNVQATLSAGRYLAGDIGGTVELSRVFDNGVKLGAFFSRTNVSAAQFGEGSFDKGVYLSLPFDAFLTRSSGTVGRFVWRPLTRDGGAKLSREVGLFDLTKTRDGRALQYRAAPPANDLVIPSARREAWMPEREGPAPYTRVTPKPAAEQWTAAAPNYEQHLAGELHRQGFRNIEVSFDTSRRLNLRLSNETLRPMGRAVGRAARTALNLGPLDMREIRVTWIEGAGPAVVYDFVDLAKLDQLFRGRIAREAVADVVAVEYINPTARQVDPLERIDDLDTTADQRSLVDVVLPDLRIPGRVMDDMFRAADKAKGVDWLRAGSLGLGLVWLGSKVDTRVDRFAKDHAGNRGVKAFIKGADMLPWMALGGAALAAYDSSDPVMSRTGYAALEAGGTAILAATGLKYAVGRARPGVAADNVSFKSFSSTKGYDAFPSRHVVTAWAVATPFAEEYDAPWLYGVAALTNLARIGSREHWFSDTVGASLLGWGIGKLFYESSREPYRNGPRVMIAPNGVQLGWRLQ